MSFIIKGVVLHITEEQKPSENFRFRELILFVDGQFQQEIKFQFAGTKADLLTGITLNAQVEIKFGIIGRSNVKEGKKSWFNILSGWDINKA